jgi:hypothetical protein
VRRAPDDDRSSRSTGCAPRRTPESLERANHPADPRRARRVGRKRSSQRFHSWCEHSRPCRASFSGGYPEIYHQGRRGHAPGTQLRDTRALLG